MPMSESERELKEQVVYNFVVGLSDRALLGLVDSLGIAVHEFWGLGMQKDNLLWEIAKRYVERESSNANDSMD